jgi:L-ascorbate metabolism protein UlaG (beta-lactamase superfamily)
LIRPVLKDHAFLDDVRAAAEKRDTLHLWWLGQSGFLVQWNGSHLLFDPYLSDSLTRKYADTDNPHVRMTEILVDPSWLDFIDVVTSSHNHTDHLDGETIVPLMKVNDGIDLVIPEANRAFVAERLHCEPNWPIGVDDGTSCVVGPFKFTGVPAAHEEIDRDEAGRHRYLGYVVNVGPWTVYHSGDTVPYDGMVDRLRPFGIDIALLPINGRAPERRVQGNLNGVEAANLAREIGARLVIPCHYEMFEFNTESPHAFEAECLRLGQAHSTLRCGERWSSAALQSG